MVSMEKLVGEMTAVRVYVCMCCQNNI